MSKPHSLILVLAALSFSSAGALADANIALNAPVTLSGSAWGVGGWGAGTIAFPGSVNDGQFKDEGHNWDVDTVWWDITYSTGAEIIIHLGGLYTISAFTLQADNNDVYRVEYGVDDGLGGGAGYSTIWEAPATGGWGVTTRSTTLAAGVIANTLRITAHGGDGLYSVTELQAFGAPVPEPETYAMLLAGLGLLGVFTRRRPAAQFGA